MNMSEIRSTRTHNEQNDNVYKEKGMNEMKKILLRVLALLMWWSACSAEFFLVYSVTDSIRYGLIALTLLIIGGLAVSTFLFLSEEDKNDKTE